MTLTFNFSPKKAPLLGALFFLFSFFAPSQLLAQEKSKPINEWINALPISEEARASLQAAWQQTSQANSWVVETGENIHSLVIIPLEPTIHQQITQARIRSAEARARQAILDKLIFDIYSAYEFKNASILSNALRNLDQKNRGFFARGGMSRSERLNSETAAAFYTINTQNIAIEYDELLSYQEVLQAYCQAIFRLGQAKADSARQKAFFKSTLEELDQLQCLGFETEILKIASLFYDLGEFSKTEKIAQLIYHEHLEILDDKEMEKLADIFFQLGKDDKAIKLYNKAINNLRGLNP